MWLFLGQWWVEVEQDLNISSSNYFMYLVTLSWDFCIEYWNSTFWVLAFHLCLAIWLHALVFGLKILEISNLFFKSHMPTHLCNISIVYSFVLVKLSIRNFFPSSRWAPVNISFSANEVCYFLEVLWFHYF